MIRMPRHEEKLEGVLSQTDPHSKGAMRSTYISKEPRGDARLVEKMFEAVVGKSVPFANTEDISVWSLPSMERFW